MRWDTLRLVDVEPADGALPLFAKGAVVRQFDTPGFRGITFYEIQARSALNRVPEASQVPFRWTVNPYRGCSHACVYCLAGDTPILMADGRTRPLADLKVGDAIYGTVGEGRARRYAVTEVQAYWSTTKPAYRITLADGRALVASGDHRFLTKRGWEHVIGAGRGPMRRPHLGPDSALAGIEELAKAPAEATFIEGTPVVTSAGLRVVSVEALGTDVAMYDMTTGTGDFIADGVVSHNCFARKTHEYLDLDSGHDFDTKIVMKVNVAERLRAELARPSWQREHVALGTNVDPYQRAEGRYELMPDIISALANGGTPFSILTKGTLILRDLERLAAAAERVDVGTAVSVGFVDEGLWRSVEPGTPSPARRLAACRALNNSGIGCGVLMAPILPYLTDSPEMLDATVEAIAAAGATHMTPIVLHLRPGAREWYAAWLREHHPDLVPRYRELYGDRSYAPKSFQSQIAEDVRALAAKHNVGRSSSVGPGRWRRTEAPPATRPGPAGEQLTLC
jgi:DNA repair photolyase